MASEENHFPFEVRDVDPETTTEMRDYFESEYGPDGFVRIDPKGYFFPKFFLDHAPTLYNTQTRANQVFVGGYPRSGTTWTQQMVWLIIHGLDYAECNRTTMSYKFKYWEIEAVLHETALQRLCNMLTELSYSKNVRMVQSSTFLKTHLPLSLLPPKLLKTSKMVYVARDPRDVIVSFYHLCKGGGAWQFKKDFKDMWNCFRKDTLIFCPYFEHVKEFWKERHNPNLLFLFYEDIKNRRNTEEEELNATQSTCRKIQPKLLEKDRLNTLRRVADFFNKSYSEEQLATACRFLDFNNLKGNKSFNFSSLKEKGFMHADAQPFIRKGVVGGWREYFDEEMSREAEQWIADNLRDTDLRFPTISVE